MDETANPLPPPPGSTPAATMPPPDPSSLRTLPTPPAAVTTPTIDTAAAPTLPPTPATTPLTSPTIPPTPTTNPTAPGSTEEDVGAPDVRVPSAPVTPVLETAPPSRSSRRGLMLGLAVACLVALGLAAFFVLGGSSDDGAPDGDSAGPVDDAAQIDPSADPGDGGAYSFSNATTTVGVSPGMRMIMTVDAPEGTVEMTALLDRRERRMSMKMDGDVMAGPGGPGGAAEMHMIADEPAATMYMSGSVMGADVPWVSIDVSAFDDLMGSGNGSWFGDPADVGDLFVGTEPVDLGIETIDGEPLKRYEVTISIADVLAIDPTALDGFGTADLTVLDSLTYDVWVDEAARFRRMAFDVELLGESVGMEMWLEHIDEPVAIPLPDAGDVMSLDEFMSSEFGALTD